MSYVNGYDDGYKKGYDDGYITHQKSNTGGFGLSEIARSCVSPEVYVDTFIKGYSKGYDDGLFQFKQEETLRKVKDEK